MEHNHGVASTTGSLSGVFPLPGYQDARAMPRGTLAGTVLTITALLLGYVGVGFARLLF